MITVPGVAFADVDKFADDLGEARITAQPADVGARGPYEPSHRRGTLLVTTDRNVIGPASIVNMLYIVWLGAAVNLLAGLHYTYCTGRAPTDGGAQPKPNPISWVSGHSPVGWRSSARSPRASEAKPSSPCAWPLYPRSS